MDSIPKAVVGLFISKRGEAGNSICRDGQDRCCRTGATEQNEKRAAQETQRKYGATVIERREGSTIVLFRHRLAQASRPALGLPAVIVAGPTEQSGKSGWIILAKIVAAHYPG